MLKITLVKSLIKGTKGQIGTVKALGLNKINSYVIKEKTPVTMGMVRVLEHMVKVTEEK